MAADSSACSPGGTHNRAVKLGMVELLRPRPFIGHPPVVLYGVAGHPRAFQLVHEFLSGDTDELDLGAGNDGAVSEVLLASLTGAWLWNGDRPLPLILEGKAAIGSGGAAALGAMFVGADAVRAVEVACAIDAGCVDPVQAFVLPRPVPLDASEIELQEVQPEGTDHGNDEQGRAGTRDGGNSGPPSDND